MAKDYTRNTIVRQWELLKLLPSAGSGKTIKEMTSTLVGIGFPIGERQVERDLKQLSDLMPIECKEGKPLGWRWRQGAHRQIGSMSLPEALSWQLVADTVTALLPKSLLVSLKPHFEAAAIKLATLSSHHASASYRDKVRVIPPTLPVQPPTIIPEVLDNIQDALLKGLQIKVRYKRFGANYARRMVLHPLGLVLRGAITYLLATVDNYSDVLLFALHRFEKAEELTAKAHTPEGFRIDDYINNKGIAQFGNGELIQLTAHINKNLTLYLQETPLSVDQVIVAGESRYQLKATIVDSWQLHWWILSQGDSIEIVEPAYLRDYIWSTLKGAAKQYAKSDKNRRKNDATIEEQNGHNADESTDDTV